MKRLEKYLLALAFMGFQGHAAESTIVSPNQHPNQVKTIKIMFSGLISQEKIADLSKAIQTISRSYPSVKNINMYLNNTAGYSDLAVQAYYIIKNSPIPITTVNVASLDNEGALMYCGGNSRLVLPNSYFFLMATKFYGSNKNISPDSLKNEKDIFNYRIKAANNIFKKCMNISEAQINAFLFSDKDHMFLDTKQALKTELATGSTDKIESADASIYIYDKN